MSHCQFTRYVLAFCLITIANGKAQNTHVAPRPTPIAPMTDQDVLLLFAGRSANDQVLLTLNNNRPQSLEVALTAYDTTGTPRVLPSLIMNASESRLIDFSRYLRGANEMARLGFLKVHYSGRAMELGAQLTLYPIEGRGGLDSPRSLSVDFLSTERHAVAWTPPGSESTFAITNVSAGRVESKVMIDGASEDISLEPNQTILRTRGIPQDIRSSGLIELDVSFNGPVDALRVYGYVSDPASGPLPIRTYDPHSATTTTLSAVGLATKNETHVVLRNLLGRPVLVIPSLVPLDADSSARTLLAPMLIPSHSSLEVPVNRHLLELVSRGVSRATLFLRNEAPVGALVGAVDQQVAPGLIEDVPLKTSNPNRYMRGIYPLRWEGDYTNRPMIANTSDEPATVRAFVVAGGVTYTFPDTTVPAGTSVSFDVDTARLNQRPDSRGSLIPLTSTFGKFHWLPVPGIGPKVGLHGRTELQSLATRRSSSFSCGNDCQFESWSYPYFDTNPFDPYPLINTFDARETTGHDNYQDTYGNRSSRSIYLSNIYQLQTDNPSILYVDFINNGFTMRSNTGAGGTTNLNYYFTNQYTYISSTDDGNPGTCTVQDDSSPGGGPVTVQIPTTTEFNYVIRDGPSTSCPAGFAGRDTTQSRYIADQNQNLIYAPQHLHESVSIDPSHNNLNIPSIMLRDADTTDGFYTDRLQFCSQLCPDTSNTTNATQVVQVTLSGTLYTVRPNSFVYACGRNTINGQ